MKPSSSIDLNEPRTVSEILQKFALEKGGPSGQIPKHKSIDGDITFRPELVRTDRVSL